MINLMRLILSEKYVKSHKGYCNYVMQVCNNW